MENALAASQIGIWCVLVVQFVLFGFFVRMVRRFNQQARQLQVMTQKQALTVGETAPAFQATDQQGRVVRVGGTGVEGGSVTMVLFVLHTCHDCHQILPRLGEVRERYPQMNMIVIGSEEGQGEDQYVPSGVSFIRSNEIRKRYAAKYVPHLVVLDQRNRVVVAGRVNGLADFLVRLERSYAQGHGGM